ncbi:hypothetical protein DVDV_3565 [Desulfovibrio sp. DV]|nr:hypothetical protein DVDV_3565 [Desulfovibrio sp. DV]
MHLACTSFGPAWGDRLHGGKTKDPVRAGAKGWQSTSGGRPRQAVWNDWFFRP